MKLLVTYKPGLVQFARSELESLGSDFKGLKQGYALIDADFKGLVAGSVFLESVNAFIGLEKDINSLKSFNYSSLIKSSESFKISSKDRSVCVALGQFVKDSTNSKVSLDNPDKVIIVEAFEDKLLVFLVLSGETKLTRRGYSVANSEFITPDVARAMVDYSGWSDNGALLDPYSHEGYIIIEAVLKALKIKPGVYKSKEFAFINEEPLIKDLKSEILCFSNDGSVLKFAKQGAKLAKVSKQLKFGLHDLEDLDYKIKENSIDYVITALPKNTNIDKLFFQLDYIMKNKAVVVLLTNQDISSAKEYAFNKIGEMKLSDNKTLIKLVRL